MKTHSEILAALSACDAKGEAYPQALYLEASKAGLLSSGLHRVTVDPDPGALVEALRHVR